MVVGFLVGMVAALVVAHLSLRSQQKALASGQTAAWASMFGQALSELKSRQEEADSQRARAELKALQAELLYRLILDTVPNAVLTFDEAGRIVAANPVALRLFPDLSSPLPEPLLGQVHQALAGQVPPYVETELALDHRSIPVGVQTRPLATPGGTAGAVMVLVELTELRRLQTKARLMEELADLGQLAAGIAHEFRNACSVLRASAQFLAQHLGGEAQEAVDDLLRETDRLAKVTSDLLDFARPWEPGVEPVNVDAVVRHAVTLLDPASAARVELSLHCPDTRVLGKASLLARAVDNLIRNALEASPGGAPVRVETATICNERGSWAALSVVDSGVGLPPGKEEEVFSPFFTTKAGGSGMGLALVRKIVTLHGGTISLCNRPQGGVEALVLLPVSPEGEEGLSAGERPDS